MQNANKYSDPIRWGIIGCGDVTELKSGPAYQKTKGFTLEAVMRRNLEKAKDYAIRHQVAKYYDDATKLINSTDIDAVYIATPPDSHMKYAIEVAEAGKPCCIEKPMALNYAQCSHIYRAFETAGIPLFVAYYRRTLPRFLKVKACIDSGEIGKVRHLSWTLSKCPSPLDQSSTYNWRTDVKVARGGYFDDLASHGLNLFHFLLGEVTEASGHSANQQGLYSSIDSVSGAWIHSSGVTGSGNWNFGSKHREDKVVIYGSSGKISFSIFEEAAVFLENDDGRQEFWIEHPKHVQLPHVEAMSRHLTEEDYRHPSTGESALHTSWIMDKILGNI